MSAKFAKPLVVLCIILSAAACGGKTPASGLPDDGNTAKMTVTVFRTRYEKLFPKLELSGGVKFSGRVAVFPPFPGTIESINVETGDRVNAGDIICTIESEELETASEIAAESLSTAASALELSEEILRKGNLETEARLERITIATAELEARQTSYDNISKLYKNKKELYLIGGITENELDSYRTEYENTAALLKKAESELLIMKIGFRNQDLAEAGVESDNRKTALIDLNTRNLQINKKIAEAELRKKKAELSKYMDLLSKSDIRAPINGIVAAIPVSVREDVSGRQELVAIIDDSQIIIESGLSESVSASLHRGSPVNILKDEWIFRGEVKTLAPYINRDTSTRTIEIECLDSTAAAEILLPGMFVTVEAEPDHNPLVIKIPDSAVLEGEDGHAIAAVIKENCLYYREIETVRLDHKTVRVLSGLTEDEIIWKSPSKGFREGTEVEIYEP